MDRITERTVEAGKFLLAVEAGSWDAADALLDRLDGPHDAALSRAVATLHQQRQRWAEAAEALERLDPDDASAALQRTLCRNLAALRTRRPAVYRTLLEAPPAGDYRPHRLASGVTTIARVVGTQTSVLCGDPVAQVQTALTQLQPAIERGDALALLSIGDGHILHALASRPPELFLGRQQPLFVLEPDPHLLLTCLMLHDCTGPLGPIEQDRVLWYVGPAWADTLRLDVITDRYLPFPKINIKQGAAAGPIEAKLVAVLEELGRVDARAGDVLREYYPALGSRDYARALSGQAGRAPRVLLLTTRFSTVLQHSTRDADDAFRRLGCDTAVVIEPSSHHVLSRSAIRRTLAEFKPDLVLQIDHHRFEHGDLFPPNLPFVNWIQDLLPHLMTPSAGRQIGASDFVLTPSLQRWVDDFAYPQRQCIEFRKLTRVPHRPPARKVEDDRVVYVSNWSQTRAQITAELLNGTSGTTRDVIAEACVRMKGHYDAGDHLASPGDVRRLLEKVLLDVGAAADESLVRQTTTRLFDRLNNLLYRQQGLGWAAEACRLLGLKLEIYGSGWDANPQFAANACGKIAYGRALEELTRQATVNLILEPFMCLAHQRLLDAVAAGGFCVVRDHPANHTSDEWIDLLAAAGTDVTDAASLRERLSGEDLARFDANFAACEKLDGAPRAIDHVATVARMQQSGFFPARAPALPLLDRNSFLAPDGLLRVLTRATRDAEFRTNVAAAQRQVVEGRYSYFAGMRRMLDFVTARLTGPALAASKAA